jgi:hypothetical protein
VEQTFSACIETGIGYMGTLAAEKPPMSCQHEYGWILLNSYLAACLIDNPIQPMATSGKNQK